MASIVFWVRSASRSGGRPNQRLGDLHQDSNGGWSATLANGEFTGTGATQLEAVRNVVKGHGGVFMSFTLAGASANKEG